MQQRDCTEGRCRQHYVRSEGLNAKTALLHSMLWMGFTVGLYDTQNKWGATPRGHSCIWKRGGGADGAHQGHAVDGSHDSAGEPQRNQRTNPVQHH